MRSSQSIPPRLCALLVLVGLLAGCGPSPARTARFRDRPDSVAAGDLRGPFNGKVSDATTGAPIAGALVYGVWTYEAGAGFAQPAGVHSAMASTDARGKYRIARVGDAADQKPIAGARLVDFQLVVYKAGYVAYRSDRRFADLAPRLDFAQRNNQIALERWQAHFSHAKHLSFVGVGPAIVSLTRGESLLAAAELSGDRRLSGGTNAERVVAGQLINEQMIKKITKFDGDFESGPLGDEPDSDRYSSQHFKALGRPETFDVAVRVWRTDLRDAQSRYAKLLTSLPGVTEREEIADRSLRAVERDIFGVGFLDARRGIVVLITCGQSQCTNPDQAVRIARALHANVRKLVPIGEAK